MEQSVKAMAHELEEVKREVTGLRVELEDMRELVENQICTYCGRHMSEHVDSAESRKKTERALKDCREGRGRRFESIEEMDNFFKELQKED